MNTDIYFFGLRRSGNHAVIDWLLAHHENWTHYNNVDVTDEGFQLDEKSIEKTGTGDFKLVSIEDYDLNVVKDYKLRVILLRDPYNLFASRLKMVRRYIDEPSFGFTCLDLISRRAFGLWKQYAKEFIYNQVKDTVFINFNMWYSDLEYRQDISRALGWNHTDTGFDSSHGWKHSGGSSFGDINVLESYKHMSDDEEFLSLFDEEVVQLAEIMYGPRPDLNLKFDSAYHEQVDKLVSACFDLSKKDNDKAIGIVAKLEELYPSNTQIKQLRKLIR